MRLNHDPRRTRIWRTINLIGFQESTKMVRRDGKIMLLFILFFALFKWLFI
jgi:hypothetical protein